MIIAIISVVMLFITGAIGWWSMSIESESERGSQVTIEEISMDFTLEEISARTTTTEPGGETETDEIDGPMYGDMKDVGETTGLLFTLGIIMTVLVIILLGLFMAIVRLGNPGLGIYTNKLRKFSFLFAVLAVVFIVIAPIYYMILWPGTVDEQLGNPFFLGGEDFYDGSFMGSNNLAFEDESWFAQTTGTTTNNTLEVNWGPSLGWILAFACVILLVITLIHVRSAGIEAMKLVPPPQPFPHPPGDLHPTQKKQPPRKIQPTRKIQPPPLARKLK
jgi:hypothetical protein